MQLNKTLSERIDELKTLGYIEDFNLRENFLEAKSAQIVLLPSEFKVDSFYRFEDNTDPGDQAILYAISSEQHNIKGVLVNAYGLYSDAIADDMVHKLMVK